MKPNPLTKKIIFAAMFLLVALVCFWFLYREIYDTELESTTKLNEWKLEASRREEIKSLDSMMRKIAKEQALVGTHFAESTNSVSFFDTVERLATSVGAKNTLASIELSSDKSSMTVGMNVSGSFESFYKFLTLLENSPYVLEFISVNLAKDGGGEGSAGAWSAALKVKVLTFVK